MNISPAHHEAHCGKRNDMNFKIMFLRRAFTVLAVGLLLGFIASNRAEAGEEAADGGQNWVRCCICAYYEPLAQCIDLYNEYPNGDEADQTRCTAVCTGVGYVQGLLALFPAANCNDAAFASGLNPCGD